MGLLTTSKFGLSSKNDTYNFSVYSIDTDFKEKYGGVYVFTRRTVNEENNGVHSVIYIGKTVSFNQRFDTHEKMKDVLKLGGNCVCVLPTASEQESLKIEKELLENNKTPLNIQNN